MYNVRVQIKRLGPDASKESKDRMLRESVKFFRRKVDELGIITQWKENQYFESKSEKRRRKQKMAALIRRKDRPDKFDL